MAKLLVELFELFAAETGILGEIRQYQELGILLLAALAVLSCFLGVRTFRLIVAVWMYITVILLSCVLFRDRMDWGAITVFFSIMGFVMAFLAFQWNRAGIVIVTALIATAFGGAAGFPLLGLILCALAGGALAVRFPGAAVCGATAAFGGVLLAGILPGLLPLPRGAFIPMAVVLTAAGLGLQLFLAERGGLLRRRGMEGQ